jgi:F-type H+-transporting ATPase subunit c
LCSITVGCIKNAAVWRNKTNKLTGGIQMAIALGMWVLGGGFGAGFIVLGAALGIGKLATGALEGMARQPELSGDLRTAMIIAAALIEGFTFFALVVTFMLATKTAPTPAAAPAPAPAAQQAAPVAH